MHEKTDLACPLRIENRGDHAMDYKENGKESKAEKMQFF
jgi:hypothetical protein